jgi:ribosomal protein L37E
MCRFIPSLKEGGFSSEMLNIDKDFCESCGYPSEEFKTQSSWLTTAIEEEG